MDIVNKTLVSLIVIFALLLIAVDKIFNSEGEVFQVFSTLLSGFSAAFIARITPHTAGPAGTPPGNVTLPPIPQLEVTPAPAPAKAAPVTAAPTAAPPAPAPGKP